MIRVRKDAAYALILRDRKTTITVRSDLHDGLSPYVIPQLRAVGALLAPLDRAAQIERLIQEAGNRTS